MIQKVYPQQKKPLNPKMELTAFCHKDLFFTKQIKRKIYLVEAAGIEPASLDISA